MKMLFVFTKFFTSRRFTTRDTYSKETRKPRSSQRGILRVTHFQRKRVNLLLRDSVSSTTSSSDSAMRKSSFTVVPTNGPFVKIS